MAVLDDAAATEWDAINRHLVTARLASATVHDARNVLQTISGMAELISMRRAADKPIDDRVIAIQQLCMELGERLDAYRAVQAERPSAVGTVDLGVICGRAIELRATSWGRTHITVANSVSEGLLVSADPPGLLRIVLNLLLNAEQALGDNGGGRITVSARVDGDLVRLVVEDSGPGVPPEEEPHLFTIARADGRLATGLWASARLAALSNGTLTWLGADGRRAAFELTLRSGG